MSPTTEQVAIPGQRWPTMAGNGRSALSPAQPLPARKAKILLAVLYMVSWISSNIGSGYGQCWLIISEMLWHSAESNFIGNAQYIHPWYEFESYEFKITAAFLRNQCVQHYFHLLWNSFVLVCPKLRKLALWVAFGGDDRRNPLISLNSNLYHNAETRALVWYKYHLFR